MRSAVLLAACGLIAFTVNPVSLPGGSGAHAQGGTTVEVGDNWFCAPGDSACMATDPDDVDVVTTVNAGDTVAWNWVGSLPHTTTACSGSDFATCDQSQGWDSGIQTGGTFSFAFTAPGTFYYRCNVHPDEMRGQIAVLAAQQPSPTPSPTPSHTPSPTPTTSASPSPVPSPLPSASTPSPAAVPAGGGAPPADGGAAFWWLAVAVGAFLTASAGVLALPGLRR